MCFGCSKEPSQRDGSFGYLQHMFWLRNKKNNFQLHTLIWRTVEIFSMTRVKIDSLCGSRSATVRIEQELDIISMAHDMGVALGVA